MKCKDCNVWGCQHRTSNAEQECVLQNIAGHIITQPSEGTKGFLVPEGTAMTIDWSSFRREAAKDFISGMLANVSPAADQWTTPEIVTAALEIADELIRQLKQE